MGRDLRIRNTSDLLAKTNDDLFRRDARFFAGVLEALEKRELDGDAAEELADGENLVEPVSAQLGGLGRDMREVGAALGEETLDDGIEFDGALGKPISNSVAERVEYSRHEHEHGREALRDTTGVRQ